MNKQIKAFVAIVLLVTVAIALTYTTYGAISVRKDLSSVGTVTSSANLGVYSDSNCQTPLTSIDWGSLAPGATVTRTIYVKNTGTGVSLTLSMATSNWNPTSANGPVTLTWNQAGTRLSPGQSTAAVLTLTVTSTITDVSDFSVQISITGTQ